MEKSTWVTISIIFGVIIIATVILNKQTPGTSKDIAECIGKESTLYTQLGCHACETQEEMFGENYQYLNIIDCLFEKDKCSEITATPTWIINGEKYIGVQNINKLKDLTNCK